MILNNNGYLEKVSNKKTPLFIKRGVFISYNLLT